MGDLSVRDTAHRFIEAFNDLLKSSWGVQKDDSLTVIDIGLSMDENRCVRSYCEVHNERTDETMLVDIGSILFDPENDEIEDVMMRLEDLGLRAEVIQEKFREVFIS